MACSSIYYALFHTLCHNCANALIGQKGTRRAWAQLYRAVDHGPALECCKNAAVMVAFPVEIQDFAYVFVQMQTKRHKADYDPNECLYKSAVAADIQAARAAIDGFKIAPLKHRKAFAAHIITRNKKR